MKVEQYRSGTSQIVSKAISDALFGIYEEKEELSWKNLEEFAHPAGLFLCGLCKNCEMWKYLEAKIWIRACFKIYYLQCMRRNILTDSR